VRKHAKQVLQGRLEQQVREAQRRELQNKVRAQATELDRLRAEVQLLRHRIHSMADTADWMQSCLISGRELRGTITRKAKQVLALAAQ
jgi:hypothetical protein